MQRHSMGLRLIVLCIVLGLTGLAAAQQPGPGGTLRVARDSVKGYEFERGFKIRFEHTWLDKPQR